MQGVLVAGRLRATPRTLIVCPAGFSMSADMRTNPDCEKELAQPVRPCKHPPRPKDHLLKRLWLAAQKRRLPRGLACNPHVKLEQGIDDFLSLRSHTGQQNPEPGEALPLCCSLAPQVAGALGKAHSPSQRGVMVPAVCRDRLLSAASEPAQLAHGQHVRCRALGRTLRGASALIGFAQCETR